MIFKWVLFDDFHSMLLQDLFLHDWIKMLLVKYEIYGIVSIHFPLKIDKRD